MGRAPTTIIRPTELSATAASARVQNPSGEIAVAAPTAAARESSSATAPA